MDVITRSCPRCNAPLDVEPHQSSLDCRYCGCAIEVTREGSDRDYRLTERPGSKERRVVPRPESVKVDETGGGLTISWRWFTPILLFLIFFCIGWNAFLLVWYGIAASFGGMAPWPFRLLMFVFPLAHVAVGIGLTYFVVAGLFNTTCVQVDRGTLSVTHGPIPWKQPPTIPTDSIEQIYVERSLHQSENRTSYGYQVNVLQKDGTKSVLLKRLTDSDKALFVSDRLQRHLDIASTPVAGEYTG